MTLTDARPARDQQGWNRFIPDRRDHVTNHCLLAAQGQLQADVIGGKLLGGDPRANNDGHQQAGTEQLGQGAAPEGRLGTVHATSLTHRKYLSQT